jgi:adenine-specific DNA-methyltransferase
VSVALAREAQDSVPSGVADVIATIPAWWKRRAQLAGLPAGWQDYRRALAPPPILSAGAPIEELYDASLAEVGDAYLKALDPSTRLRQGRHYTPERLARAVWDEIEEAGYDAGRIVDPACGTGSLLLEPLRNAVASVENPTAALDALPDLIAGQDTDKIAVWLGNALLAAEMLPVWARIPERRRRPVPQLLRFGDGLAPSHDRPKIIVMNPPYGRVRLDMAERIRWQETLYGHANRYALFLQAAIERASPGALIAAVIPTSFLGGAYFQRLRRFITERAPLVRLTFVDGRAGVFAGDVLQETCLAIFGRDARPTSIACSQLSLNGSIELRALPSAPSPRAGALPWLLPRHPADGGLLKVAARMSARLPDYGWKASTGPLVWNRHKGQIFAEPRRGRLPILWAADIDAGCVCRNRVRDQQRWIALRPQDEFMKLTEPAVLVKRTTAPEQLRRLIAGRIDADTLARWGGAVVVENHVNVLRASDPSSPLTAELLERLLQTPTFDRLYRCLTGTVAVSAYELEALALPPAPIMLDWERLSHAELIRTVASYYGDETP